VFVYRSSPGAGANSFKGIKLRWLHGADKVPDKDIQLSVHALGMVYVPEGSFASRSPWGHALKTITTPDATQPGGHLDSGPETMPLNASWPNGYKAFYFMKYSISQGQYAEFLNSVALPGAPGYNDGRYGCLAHNNFRRHSNGLYGFNGHTIRYSTGEARYEVDTPDRLCKLMSLPDILSFAGWAGLRPPSNLEYEKACRGPRAVARGADAWTPATCAPASGLDKTALGGLPAVGPGPSYWGIREMSLSGCVQEWSVVVQNEWKVGVGVKGLHGKGSPEALEEWPWGAFGEWYYGGIWRCPGYGTIAQWVDPAELNWMPWELMDGCRGGRYGAHAARTAPK
jgi:formylglycine-generating enzyme required for sulfatase activity